MDVSDRQKDWPNLLVARVGCEVGLVGAADDGDYGAPFGDGMLLSVSSELHRVL